MVMGMGFPAYRGGLIFWADLVGAGGVCWVGWRAAGSGNGRGKAACLPACHRRRPRRGRSRAAPRSRRPPVAAEHIRARLAGWAQQFEGSGLDGFFKPCAYLEACARSGTKLSAGKPSASKL